MEYLPFYDVLGRLILIRAPHTTRITVFQAENIYAGDDGRTLAVEG